MQVARDLFTNLGEFKQKYCYGIDNFPVIESRGCGINVRGGGLLSSQTSLNMIIEQITNKYLNRNRLSLLIDEYAAQPAENDTFEKCEPGAENGLVSDDKVASVTEKNVLQNEEKSITEAKNNDPVITEEKPNEYKKKLDQSVEVSNQTETITTGIETINANVEESKSVTQKAEVDNVNEILSGSICTSDSPPSFKTANSECESNSDSSLNTAEDAYLDCSDCWIADTKNMLSYRPDIIGFPEVKTDQLNKSESEPICMLEVSPISVDSRPELNEAFHTEYLDDTVNYMTNDSVEVRIDNVIDSSVVEEEIHEDHLNSAARNDPNCSDGLIECIGKAEDVLVCIRNANISMMQVPTTFNMSRCKVKLKVQRLLDVNCLIS